MPNSVEKGVKLTHLGVQLYTDNYKKMRENVYQLVGEPYDINTIKIKEPETDLYYAYNGYVTISPIFQKNSIQDVINVLKGKTKW